MKRLLTLFIILLVFVALSAYLLINNKSLSDIKKEFIKSEKEINKKEEIDISKKIETPQTPQNSTIQEKRDALKKMFN